jgi:uncharacterized protein (TIGR02147 family)
MEKRTKINIFEYTDYRKYLKDYYNEQKSVNKAFSYRYFAQKAGFNSSGLFKDITDGRCNMQSGMIMKFSKTIGLNKKEEEYFENMVYFNQAKSTEEKKRYFERMMRFYDSKAYKVDANQYEYYTKWYYSAIRELLAIGKFKDDYNLIAGKLNPKISSGQAKKAIQILSKLSLIRKNKSGYYECADEIITTGPEIKSLSVANFQKVMMEMAKEAIDRHPSSHRNISTVTFSASKAVYKDIEKELIACRKRILNMIKQCNNMDSVYQLNLQLFPLTKIEDK